MHTNYYAYGLHLRSNVNIPGLQSINNMGKSKGVDINMGFIPKDIRSLINHPEKQYYFEPGYLKTDPPHLIINSLDNGSYFHLLYHNEIEFVCNRSATLVWGSWEDTATFEDASLYLLGPILGFMLRLRNITCLHASSVAVDGNALAITGPSGAGKSTLAASFASAGFPILTDDILPLSFIDEVIYAIPGYPRLRLFPNSFKKLSGLPNELPLLVPNWDKCYLDLSGKDYKFQNTKMPLKVIYIFDWNEFTANNIKITPIKPAFKVPLLAANTYRNELLNTEMKTKEFEFLSQLASIVKIKRIHPIDSIASIPQMRDLILSDFRNEI